MKMPHHLSGAATIVALNIVSIDPDCLNNRRGNRTELLGKMSDDIAWTLGKRTIVLFGNDKTMAFADGANIQKGVHDVVLV